MNPIIIILIIAIGFWSVITTFTAIVRILSNDFNGSKWIWILISMIGVIGPVLWLSKGRKLLIKK